MTHSIAKLPVAFAASLGLAAAAAADTLDDVKERGSISIGIKNDYRPFGYLDESGKTIGFEIDLARYVAEQIVGPEGEVELVPVVASNRIELLNAGRIDVILATLGVNEKRAKVIDFTEEFYSMAGMILMTPKDSTLTSWEEVKGVTLCGIQGNLYNRTLEETYSAELMLFAGTAEMFSAYEDGRCAAVAFDGPMLQLKVSEPGWSEGNKIAVGAFDFIPIAGGVRKGEERFLKAVNDAILAAEADNILVDAEQKYSMGASEYVSKRAEAARDAGH